MLFENIILMIFISYVSGIFVGRYLFPKQKKKGFSKELADSFWNE